MRLAITGSTGSLGSALISALANDPRLERLVAISRDEVKSGDLAERWPNLTALKCMLGDVRDVRRLEEVFRGCDTVIHGAALKRITESVYSPSEVIKTNVVGTMNVIRAAMDVGVKRIVIISSDKCVEAVNLYGMSKAVAECYAVQSNSYAFPRGCRVAAVRYGNVLLSRGSVAHIWRAQLARGEALTITSPIMTRFILTLRHAAAFVLSAIEDMEGGEIFVPQLPATRVDALAQAVIIHSLGHRGNVPIVVTGLRPGGEKLHEALLSSEEPQRSYRVGERIIILPSHHSWRGTWEIPGERVAEPYTSDAPARWLSIDEMVTMLEEVPDGH